MSSNANQVSLVFWVFINYYYRFFRSNVFRIRNKNHSSLFWLHSSKYTKESSLHNRTCAKCFCMYFKGSIYILRNFAFRKRKRDNDITFFSENISSYIEYVFLSIVVTIRVQCIYKSCVGILGNSQLYQQFAVDCET